MAERTQAIRIAFAASMVLLSSSAVAQTCCSATAKDFPKVGGNYGNDNYSSLSQINRSNLSRLGAAWHNNLEGGSRDAFQQATLVAVDGVLYMETTQGNVFAIDGRTGKTLWKYASNAGIQLHRGVAVGDGKVYATLAERQVVALDRTTGAVVWKKKIVEDTGSFKSAIVYYDGLIYFGTADATRGVAYALHADTGEVAWKFYGTPGPGEQGHETWPGDAWKTGGASPWMHPAIDPELKLLYWTFGNARSTASDGPVNGSTREGQNLFANSLVALDATTGKMAWYFQSIHHDIWDMDGVMAPVLFDGRVHGQMRKGIVYGSKTGLYYVLDRVTGKPLTPIVETPVPQSALQKTWPTQPIPVGDPMIASCPAKTGVTAAPPNYQTGCLFTPHTDQPVVVAPGIGGGADWSALSFNPNTHLLYSGLGLINAAHSLTDGGVGFRPLGEMRSGRINAFNPATHKVIWHRDMTWSLAHGNGILTTAGNVMFIGQPDGVLLGLDIRDGHELWHFQTGAGVHSSPITYEVDGTQYIAVFAGGNGLPYNSPRGDDLWAFRLGGTVPQAQAPTPPSIRQPILSTAVEGAAAHNTVTLARTWSRGQVASVESTTQNSMAPQKMRVPVGTRVTFLNPAGNTANHCATQFYEGLFQSGPLAPGQSFTYTFTRPGEYFYNDCTSPRTTGEIDVY